MLSDNYRCDLATLTSYENSQKSFNLTSDYPSYIPGGCAYSKKSETSFSKLDRILTNSEKNELKSMDRSIYNTK